MRMSAADIAAAMGAEIVVEGEAGYAPAGDDRLR